MPVLGTTKRRHTPPRRFGPVYDLRRAAGAGPALRAPRLRQPIKTTVARLLADIGAGSYADIQIHVTRSDGGTYDQGNDHSYNGSGSALMETTRITVNYKGALIYGAEP
jgi:hypothetical protein